MEFHVPKNLTPRVKLKLREFEDGCKSASGLACSFDVDEKRKNTIPHLLCSRCVYDARPHLK
ncbi:hypothetical protein, partial [Anaerobutyricum soehngenii]|uniref:hypothetical protein n=1 Tax=Anaerobutyricum soehngenii TaxID=105843 RepID=UPI001ADDD565